MTVQERAGGIRDITAEHTLSGAAAMAAPPSHLRRRTERNEGAGRALKELVTGCEVAGDWESVSLQPKRLRLGTRSIISCAPNFARACGRVSIGGHPDKRPDSRLRKQLTSLLMRSAAGGETGAPRSPRGTRLKATTERAFLDPGGNAGRLKRLVLLCQQCGTGHSLIRTKAAIDVMH